MIIEDIINWLYTSGAKADPNKFNLVKSLISEELQELEDAVLTDNKEEQKDAIVDLIWVVSNWIVYGGFTLEQIQDKIERISYSNWTKFCSTLEEAQETCRLYARGQHPSKPGVKIPCYSEECNGFFIIKRISDNKIMKSINFQEP